MLGDSPVWVAAMFLMMDEHIIVMGSELTRVAGQSLGRRAHEWNQTSDPLNVRHDVWQGRQDLNPHRKVLETRILPLEHAPVGRKKY